MKKISAPIAVTSRSLSKNPELIELLYSRFENVKLNSEGRSLNGGQLIEFLEKSAGAIVALEKIDDGVLSCLPDLRAVSKYGVGLDNLDLRAMESRGVKLGWTGGVNALSVAELTLCFALGICRNVFRSHAQIQEQQWKMEGGRQLTGKTFGVVGCGHVGREVIRLLQPFKCRVLIHDIVPMAEFAKSVGASLVTKNELLRQSDLVSLHIPYDKSTHQYIGAAELELMRGDAILINTSRGSIVDELALLKKLKNGFMSAAMDVFAVEPALDNPLFGLENFCGTSHIGGSAREAILAMGEAAITNLYDLLGP